MGSNGAVRAQRTPISKRGLSDWREQVGWRTALARGALARPAPARPNEAPNS
jgi:hypothetical protein